MDNQSKKAIRKDVDKFQDITTAILKLNSWLQQKAEKVCEALRDILFRDKEHKPARWRSG